MVRFQLARSSGDGLKLYHNPRCSKSRQTLELVKNDSPEVVLYLKHQLSRKQLNDLLSRLNEPISEIIRWSDKGAPNKPDMVDSHLVIDILLENPQLMQRPILDDGNIAMICRPPEKCLDII